MSNMQALMGRDRETLDEGYPGDIVAITGFRDLVIGDTLSEAGGVRYDEIPRFSPECFAFLRNLSMAQSKQFTRGVEQLLQEGVMQTFTLPDRPRKEVLLAAIGPLQFDVVRYRLESEYGVSAQIEPAPWQMARWAVQSQPRNADDWRLPTGAVLGLDADGREALLFESEWQMRYFQQHHPAVELSAVPATAASNPKTKTAAPLDQATA
jgi:peptide chain release factor 3